MNRERSLRCCSDKAYPRQQRSLAGCLVVLAATIAHADIPRSLDADYANIRDSLNQWNQVPEQRTNLVQGLVADLPSVPSETFFESAKPLAEQGDARYECLLGFAYSYGWGTKPDKREALLWLRRAAQKDLPQAQTGLGELLLTGEGGETNQAKALELFQKSAAMGLAQAHFQLGVCHQFGFGTNVDFAAARHFYELADRQNYAPATCNLGWLYDQGQGVKQDQRKALELYRRAADRSFPMAVHNVGVAYARGQGTAQDFPEAAKWYRRAAVLGYAPAQHNLGNALLNGRGVSPDLREAEKWLQRAAEAGILEALAGHALVLLNGTKAGGSNAAIAELQMAADAGNTMSQALLGSIYARLTPSNTWHLVQPDDERAASLLRLPAETGHPVAQNALAILYAQGCGVPKDLAEAFKWMTLAARQGSTNDSTDFALATLRRDIPPRDMMEGFRRAQSFQPAAKRNDSDGDKFIPRRQ